MSAFPPPPSFPLPSSFFRSSPDPNSNLWIKVFPAGPPPQTPDQSVPCQTSTASSGSECSPLDLHRDQSVPRRTSTRAPDQSVPRRTPTKEEIMSKDMLYTYIYIYTYNYIYWNARCVYIYISLSLYLFYLFIRIIIYIDMPERMS